MKITWLGQAGLLFETADTKIIIDPYLSDSCGKVNPKLWRRFPIDESFLKIKPDVIILTHSHLDHTDPETLEYYLKNDEKVTVLASFNAWEKTRTTFKGNHNYVMFNAGTRFTENGIAFKAVYAEHSDFYAVGVIFEAEGKTYYVTGDTLYNEKVFKEIDCDIDAVFMPINGVGNNMNETDAEDFAKRIGAKVAVPLHFSLFDELKPQEFSSVKTVIPQPFKEIKI